MSHEFTKSANDKNTGTVSKTVLDPSQAARIGWTYDNRKDPWNDPLPPLEWSVSWTNLPTMQNKSIFLYTAESKAKYAQEIIDSFVTQTLYKGQAQDLCFSHVTITPNTTLSTTLAHLVPSLFHSALGLEPPPNHILLIWKRF
jgi:hypothetical protein